jgi:molybdate transport system ATP-binding protein
MVLPQLEFTLRKRFPASGAGPGFELNASLACEAGITVLFGASGSGKTVTLDSLAGLVRADHGRILLHDHILFDSGSGAWLPPQRRGIGYVVQNYALFPHMTVEQNLTFGIQHLPPLERRRRIHEALELFRIAGLAKRRPQELSGGEKQRASIARALVRQPQMLLLDEPVRGLDYPLRAEFYQILGGLRERYRIPILLVTHDVSEGFFLGNHMAVYERGAIVQVGTPEEVFREPQSPEIARLLGIANIFEGVIEELDPMADCSKLRTAHFTLRLPYLPGRLKGDPVRFCIPSDQVLLAAPEAGQSAARHDRIAVRIAEEVFAPNTVRLRLAVQSDEADQASNHSGGWIECEVTRVAYQRMKLAQQKEWLAELPCRAIHIFTERQRQST